MLINAWLISWAHGQVGDACVCLPYTADPIPTMQCIYWLHLPDRPLLGMRFILQSDLQSWEFRSRRKYAPLPRACSFTSKLCILCVYNETFYRKGLCNLIILSKLWIQTYTSLVRPTLVYQRYFTMILKYNNKSTNTVHTPRILWWCCWRIFFTSWHLLHLFSSPHYSQMHFFLNINWNGYRAYRIKD